MIKTAEQTDRAYVFEVSGRAVFAFGARTLLEARQLPKETWLLEDLAALKSNGEPIWTEGAALSVRQATDDERAAFVEAEEVSPDTDDLLLVYLVELDD